METAGAMGGVMAAAARGRGRAWGLCAEIIEMGDADVVQRLRDGRLIDDFAQAAGWLGEDDPYGADAQTLRAFVARSRRFSLDEDVVTLRAEWARLFAGSTPYAEWCRDAAAQCEAEAEAWERDDAPRAKELRLAQFGWLRGRLQPLADWCVRLDRDSEVLVARALARLVAAHLGVEAGRDVRRELFG